MDAMEKKLRRELVIGGVSHKMFCDITRKGLDAKNAVRLDVKVPGRTTTVLMMVTGEAWDSRKADIMANVKSRNGTVEIIDGRQLWQRRKTRS